VTVFSNYSPWNVAEPGRQWSLMAEVSETSEKPVDHAQLMNQTLKALKDDGLLPSGCEVVSTWHRRLHHGYPTPYLGREAALETLLPELKSRDIYSRGRFGAWTYEVSNQDHSFMQGVEVADHLLTGKPEVTLPEPAIVNGMRFLTKH